MTTHRKVACAHVRVALGRPSFECSYVGRQGCVFASCFVLFLSERALPRAAEVLPEAVGAHPQFCVSATKERIGAFREEGGTDGTEGRGGRRGGAVSLGMSRPCGWLSTHSHKYTHTDARTQPQSRLVLVKLFLYTQYCWHTPAKIPCFEGEF